jgi:hypothetical protein
MAAKSVLIALTCFSVPTALLASTQAQLVQVIQQAPTATTVRTPEGSSLAATGVALTVNISAAGGLAVPNGMVLLTDGSTAMGTVPIVNGTANPTENFSSLGIHQLSACYIATANFLPSCSTPIFLTVLAPYVLKQTEASGMITAAGTFTDGLSIIPAKGFIGTVQLSCQAWGNQCRLSATSLSFSGNGEPQTVKASFVPSAPTPSSTGFIVPLLGVVGCRRRRRRSAAMALKIFVGAIFLCGLAGCHALSYPFVPASDSMVISTKSGLYSQAVTYQITVNP